MGWLKFGGNVGVRGQLDVSIDPNTTGGLNIKRGGITVDAGGVTVTAGGLTVTAGGVAVDAGGLTVNGDTDLSGGTAILDSGTAAPDHDAISGAISVHRIGGAGGTTRLYVNPGNGTTYFFDAAG